jgi:hypothetical protein
MFRRFLSRRRRSSGKWLAAACWLVVVGFAGPAAAITQAELDTMRALWSANGSEDYNFFLQRSCFCAPQSVRPGLVEVRSDMIAAVLDAETLQPLDPQEFLTVDGLFAELQAALDLPAFAIDAQFDASLGYPTQITIDQIEGAADDVVSYTAGNLSLVPEPTAFVLAILGAWGLFLLPRRQSISQIR